MVSKFRLLEALASKRVLEEMGRRSTMLVCGRGGVSTGSSPLLHLKCQQCLVFRDVMRGWRGRRMDLLTSSTAILELSDMVVDSNWDWY